MSTKTSDGGIVVVTNAFPPSCNGVAESVRVQLDECLKRNRTVQVLAPRNIITSKYDTQGLVHRLPSYTTGFNRDYPLALPWGVNWQRLREIRPCILHTHQPFFVGWLGQGIATRLRIPLVTTYHTEYQEYGAVYASPFPRFLRRRAIRWLVESHYNRCLCVIAPSKSAAESLHAQYAISTPVEIIPTGVPLPNTRCSRSVCRRLIRNKLHLQDNDIVLFSAGRLAQEKNFPFLLRMFTHVKKTYPEAYLAIAGEGPENERCKKLAATLGLGNAVRWLGKVPHDDMITHYLGSDLFVWACQTDTQGLVINEAKAAGLPALALEGGGAGSSILDGVDGFVVPCDEWAFAQKVIEVLTKPELLHRLQKGCEERRHEYTPNVMMDRQFKVYEAVRERFVHTRLTKRKQ